MLENININNSHIIISDKNLFNTNEAYIYRALYKNEEKIIKIFKDINTISNKIDKIKLLKERLINFNNVVTADAFITYKNIIIGYMMPYIEGENIFLHEQSDKNTCINLLKQLSEILKKLHSFGVVNGDFYNNIIINNNKIYLIDHDNFSIDNYKTDLKNIFLIIYEKYIKQFDEKFDNYLLNIYTIAALKNIKPQCIYSLYKNDPNKFRFRDNEIFEIFKNTMVLKDTYDEILIIDKIFSKKDLKKIKTKLF